MRFDTFISERYFSLNLFKLEDFILIICNNELCVQELDSADRANLLNDAFNLADSEIITYDIPLKLSNYLTYEDNVVPWAVAQTEFLSLRNKLQETLAYNSSAVRNCKLVLYFPSCLFVCLMLQKIVRCKINIHLK